MTITSTVQRECLAEGAPSELVAWMTDPPAWLTITADPIPLLPETLALGAGESSAITLAWEHRKECVLILDEKRARKIARALGLRITGVLALIVNAARTRLVDFDDAINRLKQADFRIAESLIEEARQRAQIQDG